VDDAEVTALCRYIAAVSPAQQWDEFTADAWAEVIPADFTLDECRAAVIAIKQRQQWVDPNDIIDEVRRARRHADEQHQLHVLKDPAAYAAWVEGQDEAFLAKLDARRGSTGRLRAVPPPDYDDEDEGAS
jgi:hypothetical protein